MFDCPQSSGIVHCHQYLTNWLGEVGRENEFGEKDIICVQIYPINVMGRNHFMKFFSYPDLHLKRDSWFYGIWRIYLRYVPQFQTF